MAITSLRDSWYLHGELNLTLQRETSHLVIHKYELIVIRSIPGAGRKAIAKTITVLFQCHKEIVTWALTQILTNWGSCNYCPIELNRMIVLGLNCPVSVIKIRHWITPWYIMEWENVEFLHIRDCEHNPKINIKLSKPQCKIHINLQEKFIQYPISVIYDILLSSSLLCCLVTLLVSLLFPLLYFPHQFSIYFLRNKFT